MSHFTDIDIEIRDVEALTRLGQFGKLDRW